MSYGRDDLGHHDYPQEDNDPKFYIKETSTGVSQGPFSFRSQAQKVANRANEIGAGDQDWRVYVQPEAEKENDE